MSARLLRCFHVEASSGDVFGVAATAKRDAMAIVQERLLSDGLDARPVRASDVGSCAWTYGLTIHY